MTKGPRCRGTYWEELTAPDVANVLGIPENTVYSRLRRAKDHLREALARLSDMQDERDRALALLNANTQLCHVEALTLRR